MATYTARAELVQSKTFLVRVRFAFVVAAAGILADKQATTAARAWAVDVMSNKTSALQVSTAATLCSAEPAVGDAGEKATDAEIQKVIDANLDLLMSVGA